MRSENVSTILIVDNHPVVIYAIDAMISSAGDFAVTSAHSASEMRAVLNSEKCTDQNILLVFLDIQLPDANGTDLILELVRNYRLPVIAMSGQYDDLMIGTCMRNGAAGFVPKSSKLRSFSSALLAVLAGGQYFPDACFAGRSCAAANIIAELNHRQHQILELVVRGQSNKQIGNKLNLAEGTIKNRVSELLEIFGVNSRAQIVFAAAEIGYRPRPL